MNNGSSKQVLLSVLGVAILVVAVVGVSFAAFTFTDTDNQENVITTGTIDFQYSEGENAISIENAMPMSDTQGKALQNSDDAKQKFNFTISANIKGDAKVKYSIGIQKVDVEEGDGSSAESPLQLEDEYVSFYISETETTDGPDKADGKNKLQKGYETTSANSETGCPATVMEMITDEFTGTTASMISRNYSLRMWVNTDYNVTGEYKQYKAKVVVYAKNALVS